MFESINSNDERGQVGIGTLIVFIAMVLVAAIAAGVLINTAGSLQSQASDTGTETQEAVANQIEVVHAVVEDKADDDDSPAGEAGAYNEDDFDELRLVVKKSAGSDVIDMESVTIQYTSGDSSDTLAHLDNDDVGPDEDHEQYFDTEPATDDSDDTSLTSTEDRIEVIIPLGTESEEQPSALDTGDSASIQIVDQSGAQFSYGVTMPQTVSDEQTIVEV